MTVRWWNVTACLFDWAWLLITTTAAIGAAQGGTP